MRPCVTRDSLASSSLRRRPPCSFPISVTWGGIVLSFLKLRFSTRAMKMQRLRSPRLKDRLVRWPSKRDGCGPQTPPMTFASACFPRTGEMGKISLSCPSGSCHLHRAFQVLIRMQVCLCSEQRCFLRWHFGTRRRQPFILNTPWSESSLEGRNYE